MAFWGQLVNFESSSRKPNLIAFGLFTPGDNLGFIATGNGTPLTEYSTATATITGAVNGVNRVFTVASGATPETVARNGTIMTQNGVDVSVAGNVITFVVAQTPVTGDIVTVYA